MDSGQLHREAVVAVAHDHVPIGEDLQRMRAGGVTAKVYQIALDVDVEAGVAASADRDEGWLRQATQGIELALRDIEENADVCLLASTAADVRRAKSEGRIAILLGAEGARWLEGSLDPLRVFHRLGLRELQLTWAFSNQLVPDEALSEFGGDVVTECARLGVIVDVTHIPDRAFYDVIEQATKPIIVSHGAAKSATADLDDDKLRGLAGTNGLIGIHFYTTYLGEQPTPDDVWRNVDTVANLVGIEHVALGVDFFPTHGPWLQLQIDQGTSDPVWAVSDMSQVPRITECLAGRGLSDDDLRAVLGVNFLRVLAETTGEEAMA